MDELGAPRFHLVGHDWGGQIAWLIAAHQAQRVKSLAVLSRPHPAAFVRAMKEDNEQAERSRHHRGFREEGAIDFCELGEAARRALGALGDPSDLAFRLDSRIEHLLVDEFQDTSRVQVELLERLTTGWQPGDGRTLFLVGDPMQSIYRFRGAEVGLFLHVQRHGIRGLPVETLSLTANYRSVKSIVERVNRLFLGMFPSIDDVALGAIPYTAIEATQPDQGRDPTVVIHGFSEDEEQLEARKVIELVQEAKSQGSVAILVRARTHLPWIVEALKKEKINFQAVDIDPLNERITVQDLLALTRVMLHASDRISWLAILRAPWCGLTLADLEALVRGRTDQTIWESLEDIGALSEDGQRRATRLREVLADAFAGQGRWPLRRWVERVWIKLAGPACLEGDQGALEDARDYFDLLEAEQTGSDLRDLDALTRRVAQLYAKPAPGPEPWLQVMTIHKAKGLEFDTVIVPGLGRQEPIEDPQLFLFHEWPSDEGEQRLIAPIRAEQSKNDPLYEYLQEIEKRKNRLERVRQFAQVTAEQLVIPGADRVNEDVTVFRTARTDDSRSVVTPSTTTDPALNSEPPRRRLRTWLSSSLRFHTSRKWFRAPAPTKCSWRAVHIS
jgi:ATP-dependent exoDNAse (exonuclease V) beta subunit